MAYLDSSGAPTKVGGGIQYMEHANRETHITFGGDRVVSPEPAPFRQPVLTKLKAVLLAGDFGGALVADCVKLQQRVSYVMGDEGNQFATPALVRVGEGGGALPGLNYWLKQLAECPRLCPVEDKVFIVCNEDNKAALAGWAEATDGARSVLDGACFPLGNLISNGCTHPSQYAGHAQDLATFCAWNATHDDAIPDSLMVADAGYMLHPGFPFNRVVECAVTRACDAVGTYAKAPAVAGPAFTPFGQPQARAGAVVAATKDAALFNPRLGNLVAAGDGDLNVAPLLFLKDSSVPLAAAFCGERPAAALADMGLALLAAERPLYGMRLESSFGLQTLAEIYRTEAFAAFWHLEVRKRQLKSKIADTESSLDFATLHSAEDINARMESSEAKLAALMGASRSQTRDLEVSTQRFEARWRDTVTAGQVAQGSASGARRLPERFMDAASFGHKPKKQHPVYQTSSNAYGLKKITQQEMPMTWAGTNGDFSKSFGDGFKFRCTGFNTARTTSNVHKSLDG